MYKIKTIMIFFKELNKDHVLLMLLGHADDRFELIKYQCKYKSIAFPYPFYLDKTGSFLSDNQIIRQSGELNAVLIDQHNLILSSGDILNRPDVKKAFLKKIKNIKS